MRSALLIVLLSVAEAGGQEIGPANSRSGDAPPGPGAPVAAVPVATDGGSSAPPALSPAMASPAASAPRAESPRAGTVPTSSNPAAVNITTGTGAIGRLLGIPEESGIRLGGLWLGDASGNLAGGLKPGRWGLNSLTVVDLFVDAEKLVGWSGASFGTNFLQFSGQPTNILAGAFPGFDSLEGVPPLVRQELYELWYRQTLFDDRLIVRIGKTVPSNDFNNVVKPAGDPLAVIPAVTGLIYTSIFVNPTMLGVMPGYYNSATGITTTFTPTKEWYLNYGVYDGNLANRRQTGLEGPHFNGYYFHIGEVGHTYHIGRDRKPGIVAVGLWGQTGRLNSFNGGTTNGANGVYLFGSQRLWLRHPGVDSSGVSGFYQFGANNSDALLARQYFGTGLTAFGLVPGRPDDTFGTGLGWTWMTRGDEAGHVFFPDAPPGPLRLSPSQLMISAYYQMKLADGWFAQTTLTDIPTPGVNAAIPNAFTINFRLIVLF